MFHITARFDQNIDQWVFDDEERDLKDEPLFVKPLVDHLFGDRPGNLKDHSGLYIWFADSRSKMTAFFRNSAIEPTFVSLKHFMTVRPDHIIVDHSAPGWPQYGEGWSRYKNLDSDAPDVPLCPALMKYWSTPPEYIFAAVKLAYPPDDPVLSDYLATRKKSAKPVVCPQCKDYGTYFVPSIGNVGGPPEPTEAIELPCDLCDAGPVQTSVDVDRTVACRCGAMGVLVKPWTGEPGTLCRDCFMKAWATLLEGEQVDDEPVTKIERIRKRIKTGAYDALDMTEAVDDVHTLLAVIDAKDKELAAVRREKLALINELGRKAKQTTVERPPLTFPDEYYEDNPHE